MIWVFGWLTLLGRGQASEDAEIIVCAMRCSPTRSAGSLAGGGVGGSFQMARTRDRDRLRWLRRWENGSVHQIRARRACLPLRTPAAYHHPGGNVHFRSPAMRPSEAATAVTRQLQLAPTSSAPRRGSDYARLSRQIRQAGLLERRRRYYFWKISATVVLVAAGWAAFVVAGDSWWQLAVAVFLAVMFTQVGFLGHDAGHRQISGSRRVSYVLGVLLGNLGIGLSYSWWVGKHNRHHAHPNQEGADPDIAAGALAFTASQARASRGVARLAFRYQAYLFFPLLLGEAISLHVASISALASRPTRRRSWEAILLGVHVCGYLAVVFLVLSPVKAVVFIVLQQGLFGLYLGCSFAPNHKGMPILDATDHSDFLRRQVLTSRNVRCGWLTDLALGGLNYQIEHHLFPSMPRPNLRRSQPLIAAFCQQQDLPYCQSSLAGSYAQALRHLNAVGRQTHPATAT
jgi:fatty acid desaturase